VGALLPDYLQAEWKHECKRGKGRYLSWEYPFQCIGESVGSMPFISFGHRPYNTGTKPGSVGVVGHPLTCRCAARCGFWSCGERGGVRTPTLSGLAIGGWEESVKLSKEGWILYIDPISRKGLHSSERSDHPSGSLLMLARRVACLIATHIPPPPEQGVRSNNVCTKACEKWLAFPIPIRHHTSQAHLLWQYCDCPCSSRNTYLLSSTHHTLYWWV